jgi:hypothetical protein
VQLFLHHSNSYLNKLEFGWLNQLCNSPGCSGIYFKAPSFRSSCLFPRVRSISFVLARPSLSPKNVILLPRGEYDRTVPELLVLVHLLSRHAHEVKLSLMLPILCLLQLVLCEILQTRLFLYRLTWRSGACKVKFPQYPRLKE